jgi:hypothetical protein
VTVPYFLLGLAMSSMHATGSTELSKFKAIRIVSFVFRGSIIPLLANCASQGSNYAIFFTFTGHAFLRSSFVDWCGFRVSIIPYLCYYRNHQSPGFFKSLFVPPPAAEGGGKLSGDTPRPGRGYRPCTPFSATFEKPYLSRVYKIVVGGEREGGR